MTLSSCHSEVSQYYSAPPGATLSLRPSDLSSVDTDVAVSDIVGQDHNHVWLLLRNCQRRRPKNCTHDDESGNSHFCILPDANILTPLQSLL